MLREKSKWKTILLVDKKIIIQFLNHLNLNIFREEYEKINTFFKLRIFIYYQTSYLFIKCSVQIR